MKLEIHDVAWPIDGSFVIARGTITEVVGVRVELHDGEVRARGEAVGVDYKGETPAMLREQIEGLRPRIEAGLSREALRTLLAPGGARNAVDAALWDLECRRSGKRAWELADLPPPVGLESCYTISLREPEEMAAQARAHPGFKLLKVKLGRGEGDYERISAVRDARPDARLLVDANQGWGMRDLETLAPKLAALGVRLIEQPLAVGADGDIEDYRSPVPLCADESCDDSGDLEGLPAGYSYINIKLDKCGGLTEGLEIARQAERRGLRLMVGCMLGSSLAMAPQAVLGVLADYVDLDGPLLLSKDCEPALRYTGSEINGWEPTLWG